MNDYWIFDRQPQDVERDSFVGCDLSFTVPIGDVGFGSTQNRMRNFCKAVGVPILPGSDEFPRWEIARDDDHWEKNKITYLVQITDYAQKVRQWVTSFNVKDFDDKAFGVEPVLFWQELEELNTIFQGEPIDTLEQKHGTYNPYRPLTLDKVDQSDPVVSSSGSEITVTKEAPFYKVMMQDGTEMKVRKVDIQSSSILKIER